jgi:hypothetical protein
MTNSWALGSLLPHTGWIVRRSNVLWRRGCVRCMLLLLTTRGHTEKRTGRDSRYVGGHLAPAA